MRTLFLIGLFLVLGKSEKLFAQESQDSGALMECVETADRIVLQRGGKPILQYNKTPIPEAAEHESFFTRTGYIHPLYSPAGKVVTGDYSADHKHQHGLFFAWTKTRFKGHDLEFWNQKLELGTISYVKTNKVFSSHGGCGFVVEHLYEDTTGEGEPKPVLHETWSVIAIDRGDEMFEFTIEVIQKCASDSPLTIEKYHYGGMALRGPVNWLDKGPTGEILGVIETDEGKTREDGNHSRPDYVLMHGPVGDGHAGAMVQQDEGNFRYPQWVRLHPSKPYFVYAPMVEESFQILPGKEYSSVYRYVVFDGVPNAAMTAEMLAPTE